MLLHSLQAGIKNNTVVVQVTPSDSMAGLYLLRLLGSELWYKHTSVVTSLYSVLNIHRVPTDQLRLRFGKKISRGSPVCKAQIALRKRKLCTDCGWQVDISGLTLYPTRVSRPGLPSESHNWYTERLSLSFFSNFFKAFHNELIVAAMFAGYIQLS